MASDAMLDAGDDHKRSEQEIIAQLHAPTDELPPPIQAAKPGMRKRANAVKLNKAAPAVEPASDDLLDHTAGWKRGTFSNSNPTVKRRDDYDDDHAVNDDEPGEQLQPYVNARGITIEMDDYELSVRDEIYSMLRYIRDPEHPYTLEELSVVARKYVAVKYDEVLKHHNIYITFNPTVPHCSLATLIGLCLRYRVLTEYSDAKLDVTVLKGSHSTEQEINKQLADKERACAAMENPPLRDMVQELCKEHDHQRD